MAEQFAIVRDEGRIFVEGEFDLLVADQLGEAIASLDGEAVAIDLSGMTFIDSTGIRSLLRARHDPAVRIENVPDMARHLFALIGVSEMLLGDPTE
jgi:anti-anti-sigma regulatory factor